MKRGVRNGKTNEMEFHEVTVYRSRTIKKKNLPREGNLLHKNEVKHILSQPLNPVVIHLIHTHKKEFYEATI